MNIYYFQLELYFSMFFSFIHSDAVPRLPDGLLLFWILHPG